MKSFAAMLLLPIGTALFFGTASGCSKEEEPMEIVCTCSPETGAFLRAEPPDPEDPDLFTYIYSGDLEAVKKSVSLHKWSRANAPGAVIWAVKCNQPQILSWLLDHGWSAEAEEYDSPLAVACGQSCSLLRVLLKHKARLNPNHENQHWLTDYRQTALHYAIRSGRPCMVEAALAGGLDADPGRSYYPPLMEAIPLLREERRNGETICRLLVKYGADPDRKAQVFVWGEKEKLNSAEYLVRLRLPGTASLLKFLVSHGAGVKYTEEDLRRMSAP